jgi:hypothetical protein
MVKLLMVIPRRADITHEAFLTHLSTEHLKVVDRVPGFRRRVRRYIQNHLFVAPEEVNLLSGLPIRIDADGLIEVWYDSVDAIKQAFGEPGYLQVIRPDEHTFGNVSAAWGVLADDEVILQKVEFDGHIKLFVFLMRKPGQGYGQFLAAWQQVRQTELTVNPTFRAHVGCLVENWVRQDPANSLPGMNRYDLVIEMWFESLSSASQLTADPGVRAAFSMVGTASDRQCVAYAAVDYPAAEAWSQRSSGQL